MARAMVFIDGSNFYYAVKQAMGQADIDLYKLGKRLAGEDDLVRIYYYNAPLVEDVDPERYRRQQRFFGRVQATPYVHLRLGRLRRRDNTFVEKGVDVLIAVDMLRHAIADNYDIAILVSGDGDFEEALKAVADLGKTIKNACFRASRSDALVNASDVFVELTPELVSECRPDPSPRA